ncbi:VOC family protein [Carboxylicivirga sp. M1479]|uniref:VOC family protein n=1 Tax=Carboxylicivirga sp. M1479 TaxID=2594476 RepID=UPI00117803C8|nr:VOC family protein [Carboxylicivirga sp. M1479]TRX72193.1 glyoxalase/bleomycin resistance/extradiol dioxygenase family protein [Carboxylicivirga sp. M1479]
MRIEHIAIWVSNLEVSKDFYSKYFAMTANERYENTKKQFTSYFMSHKEGARIELMHTPELADLISTKSIGLAHIAFTTGSKQKVDELTNRLRADGYTIEGEPRMTGDGYYESVVLDSDGNQLEITE